MTGDLEFTGERFVPGMVGAIAYEHGHRYAFARRFAAGKRVLDAACGEGYGSAQLAEVAQEVCGIDVSVQAVEHAQRTYADRRNLRFEQGSVTALPLGDATVDVIVSFETIEHVSQQEQTAMLAEFARVLAADGLLILSSPNRARYSDARGYRNPFHVHELYRDELDRSLTRHFAACRWFQQDALLSSALWAEQGGTAFEAWEGDGRTLTSAGARDGMYYVVIAAKSAMALPREMPGLSLFFDAERSELARAQHHEAEVLRLDGLLREREDTIRAQAQHVQHLEQLVAERERLIQERDAQVNGLNATLAAERAVSATHAAAHANAERQLTQAREQLGGCEARVAEGLSHAQGLEKAAEAQDRIIAYRQSVRWWLKLPFIRAHLWWRSRVRS